MIFDDGSTDGALQDIPAELPVHVIRNATQQGAGYGVRRIFEHARQKGYTAVFFVSGNDKDDRAEIIKLQSAVEQGYDLVQGSRYLPGGRYARMPLYRRVATQFLHRVFAGVGKGSPTAPTVFAPCTGPRRSADPGQPWLNEYELEPSFYKVIKLGYKV